MPAEHRLSIPTGPESVSKLREIPLAPSVYMAMTLYASAPIRAPDRRALW